MSDEPPAPQTFDYLPKPPPREFRHGPKVAVLVLAFAWLLAGGLVVVSAAWLIEWLTPPRIFSEATIRPWPVVGELQYDEKRERSLLWKAVQKTRAEAAKRLIDPHADFSTGLGGYGAFLSIHSRADERSAIHAALQIASAQLGLPALTSFSEVSSREDMESKERYKTAAGYVSAGTYLCVTLLVLRRISRGK